MKFKCIKLKLEKVQVKNKNQILYSKRLESQ